MQKKIFRDHDDSSILNKSENATPELFAIYIKIMQTKNANESES